eukprot:CAMPEP_0194443874 /NCGR_PEP_ID=MMETSP0176-20130528/126957_1 /TAXON_ID=216777 /ORGANISM="Proboscia alata, Strain PI-D3" /LENGTH=911 /DNA_ID=CAMNT_0039270187 /DNA_START=155 /DNA_END=2893 /DNA_ORIENTATION=+
MSSNTASKTPASSSTISSSHTDSPPTKRIALESIQTSSKQEPISNSNAKDVSSSNGATPAPQSTSMDVNLKTDSTSSSAPYTPGGVTFSADKTSAGITSSSGAEPVASTSSSIAVASSSSANTANNQNVVSDVLEERLIDAEYKIWKKSPFSADKTSAGITSSSGAEPVASTSSSIAVASSSSANTANNQNVVSDVLEERLIDAEYKIWKKNTPYLYDLVMTHSLEWPSLTCQWLPTIKSNEDDKAGGITGAVANSGSEVHELLLGTHTTEGDQNYLMVGTVNLPKSDGVVDLREPKDQDSNGIAMIPPAAYDEEKREVGGFGYQTSTPQQSSNNSNQDGQKQNPSSTLATNLDGKIDIRMKILHEGEINEHEEKREVGGFGYQTSTPQQSSNNSNSNNQDGQKQNPSLATNLDGKIDIRMKILHEGEINRARYMPQNHFMVATKGPSPLVYVFDLCKHPSYPTAESTFAPQFTLSGHEREGYGLCWNPHETMQLISGGEDGLVCYWDLNAKLQGEKLTLDAASIFRGHTDVVEDVDWHKRDVHLIGSCGDDRTVRLWDVREVNPNKATKTVVDAHDADINSFAFNPVNEFLLVTGSADKTCALWDLRNLKQRLQTLVGHTDQVFRVEWSPFNESVLDPAAPTEEPTSGISPGSGWNETMQLISGGEDGLVCYWDLNAKLQGEKLTLDAASIFRGHTDVVEDVDWHKRDVHLIGSCGDDRTVRLWDVREVNPNKATKTVVDAHDADINSLAFNPVNEFLLVTGSADKTCALWDLRNLKQRLQTLVGHTDQVFRVEWSPFNESVLGSCGADRRTNVWDLSRIGMEQTSEDADDGPPELLFMHGGHTSKVSDFSWNRNDEWTIASVSEDNVLQVWNMAEEIYMLDEDMEAKNDEVDEIEMKKERDLDDAIMGE